MTFKQLARLHINVTITLSVSKHHPSAQGFKLLNCALYTHLRAAENLHAVNVKENYTTTVT